MNGLDPDALPVGIVRVDRDDRILDANAAFTSWAEVGTATGRLVSELLEPGEEFLDLQGATSTMMISRSNPARAAIVQRAEGAEGALLTVMDASERYAAGQRLRTSHTLADRTRARLELIIDASIAFADASSEERLGEILAVTAASAYRAEESAVFVVGEDGQLRRLAGTNPFEALVPESSLAASALNLHQVLTVSSQAEATAISSLAAQVMLDAGVDAVIAAPLHLDSAVLGFFACFFRHQREFDQEARPLAEALAGQAAQALATIRLQSRLEHAAMHDETTGLPNRRFLEEQIAVLNGSEKVSVIFIDLDGFKDINDRHGHQLGDEVLREVARRLQATVREGDVVARYGGDEFVVVCAADAQEVAEVAERIVTAVAQPITFLPELYVPSASVGVASQILDQRLPRIDRLIRSADHAMYLAKSDGGNRVTPAPTQLD